MTRLLLAALRLPCIGWARFWHAFTLWRFLDCSWSVAWYKACRRFS